MLSRRTVTLALPAAAAVPLTAQEGTGRLDLDLVKQFVVKSHSDLETVKALYAKERNLINASWDWGSGDWETGLGAAAHMGNRDIAHFLLDSGARIDLFAATMLGRLAVVKPLVAAFPKSHAVPGPHGIPLLSHAIAGDQAEVFEFLLAAGADVNAPSFRGATPLMAAAAGGRLEMTKRLLDSGADPSLENEKGETARDLALKRNHAEVAALLQAA